MKNRYMKHKHISERKFRQVLPLFCLDLTAVQIAQLVCLNRYTLRADLGLLVSPAVPIRVIAH
jgi:hypothetical protein